LSNYVEIVKRIDTKQSEKNLIIEPSNTVIQKPAMMVKFLGTSVASIAVVTLIKNVAIADMAKSCLV
jgi:hypothetical protein